jgi:hypothetical protein
VRLRGKDSNLDYLIQSRVSLVPSRCGPSPGVPRLQGFVASRGLRRAVSYRHVLTSAFAKRLQRERAGAPREEPRTAAPGHVKPRAAQPAAATRFILTECPRNGRSHTNLTMCSMWGRGIGTRRTSDATSSEASSKVSMTSSIGASLGGGRLALLGPSCSARPCGSTTAT